MEAASSAGQLGLPNHEGRAGHLGLRHLARLLVGVVRRGRGVAADHGVDCIDGGGLDLATSVGHRELADLLLAECLVGVCRLGARERLRRDDGWRACEGTK